MMDDLDRYIAERNALEEGFASLVEAADRRQAFAREMAERRRKRGISQTQIAARMRTSPSIVSRLESGFDVKLSTLEKYVVALGYELVLAAPKPSPKRPRTPQRRPPQRKKKTG
jgi:transcriptional regulator with XRE-family HTH domain